MKRKHRRRKGTFYVAQEKARPILAIEITSADTRVNDVSIKVEHYHSAHVPIYIIVDREREESPPRLIGYRFTVPRYVRMVPDERGRLLVKPLGVRIGVRDNRVVCYDAVTDEELGDYTKISRALATETKARQAAEQQRGERPRHDKPQRNAQPLPKLVSGSWRPASAAKRNESYLTHPLAGKAGKLRPNQDGQMRRQLRRPVDALGRLVKIPFLGR